MNRYMLKKADGHSAKLFQVTKNRPQLELLIIDKFHQGPGKWTLQAQPRVEINSENELEELAKAQTSSEWTHIYIIQHVRSWMPLDISRALFDRLLKLHNVFPEIWRVVLTFGWKRFENEYSFPTLQVRESKSESIVTQEMAYVLRRVEENGRDLPECPWSIRQTGVYQRFTHESEKSSGPASMILLVAPSREAKNEFLGSFAGKTSDTADAVTLAFSAHECLVAESLAGWGDYMCWLEEELKKKSAPIMAIPLNNDQETRTLNFDAKARQSLKEIEFQITDMLMRTVQDATAVKLLTLIGLIFLPTTMVENFFSTQFIHTEGGGLQVSKYVWVMVAVAVPLTAFVVFCWRVWVRYEYAQLPSAGLTKQRLKRLFGRRISKTEEATSIG
ncbi:hypothetical protein BDW72DRAFT_197152 [Aspergillus terricola var. indicus]